MQREDQSRGLSLISAQEEKERRKGKILYQVSLIPDLEIEREASREDRLKQGRRREADKLAILPLTDREMLLKVELGLL